MKPPVTSVRGAEAVVGWGGQQACLNPMGARKDAVAICSGSALSALQCRPVCLICEIINSLLP